MPSNPGRPLPSRNTTKSSHNILTAIGMSLRLADKQTGCQYLRNISPPRVPGPVRGTSASNFCSDDGAPSVFASDIFKPPSRLRSVFPKIRAALLYSRKRGIDESFPRLALRDHLIGGEQPDHLGQSGHINRSLTAKSL